MFNYVIGDGVLLVPQKRVVRAINNAFNPFGWSQYRQYNKGNVFEEIINNPVTIITEPFVALDREVIQPIYREVIQPVGHALEKIGQGIAKDPLTFVAQAAAIALAPVTGGMSLWALPVIAAASTAAKGGSFEDILTATAISAATAAIGGGFGGESLIGNFAGESLNFGMSNSVGGLISSGLQTGGSITAGTATFSIAGMSITASTASAIAAAGQGLAMGAVAATGAAIKGQDPLSAALPSVVGTALGFAGNQVGQADFLKPVANTLSDISKNVSPIVSKAMMGVASAALTGAVTGKDMTQVALASLANTAISGIVSASNVVADFFKDDYGNITKFGTATQSIVADLVGSVAATVASGGKLGAPMGAQFLTNTVKTLTPFLTEGFNSLAEEVRTMYIGAEGKVIALNNAATSQQGLVDKYNADADKLNGLATEVNDLIARRDATYNAYNAATTQSEVNRLKAEFQSLESQIADKTGQYNAIYDTMDDTNAAYLDAVKATEAAQKDYFEASKALGSKGSELSTKMNEISTAMTTNLAKEIDPNFNAEEYKTINNLGPGVDPHTHFLSAGKDQGLATNFDAVQAPKEQQMTTLMEGIAKLTGRELASYDANEIADLRDKLESKYGNNLWALQNTTAEKIVKESGVSASDWLDPGGPKSSKASDWFYKTYGGTTPFGTRQATQAEVATGKASLMYLDGQPVWLASNGQSASVIYSPDSNTVIKNVTLSTYSYTDSDGQRHIVDKPVTVGDYVNINTGKVISPASDEVLIMPKADGWVSVEAVENDGQVQRVPIDDLGGLETLYTYGGMDKNAAALVVDLGGVAKSEIINASKSVIEAAQSTGNSLLINSAANVVKAGGGFITAIGGIATMLGQAPKDSDLGKQLEALGKAGNTKEYQDAINNINNMVGKAKGVGGTLNAIWEGFKSAPLQFVAEYIGVEGFQEIAPLLIGGGAGTYAKGLALAKGMGEAAAAQIGRNVALRGSMASDLIESIGGQATSSFDTTYALARQKGMTEAAATNYALDVAAKSGLMSGVLTAGSFGLGGLALEKAFMPSGTASGMFADAAERLWDFTKTGASITIKEGVSEAGEEGLNQLFLETQLYKLDPTRDVAANVTSAASFGFLAGGPIAGGTFATANGADILNAAFTVGNEQFTKQLQSGNYTMGELGVVLNQWLPPAAQSQGLRDILVPSILQAVPQYAANYSNAGDFIEAVKTATGVWDASVLANVTERVDNGKFASQVTSTQEAIKMLQDQGLTGVKAEDAARSGIVGVVNPDQANKAAQYVNQQMVSEAELQAAAKQENYTPTKAELDKLVGRGVEANVIAQFIKDVDPKATTTAEATQYFKDLGYTKADAAAIAQFVKSAPETEMQAAVAAYVDPRQVTRQEAIKFFSDQGYTPTEAEINQYIVQGPEVVQSNVQKQLETYVDPRVVDKAEAKAMLVQLGVSRPTNADVEKFMGQYNETLLAGKVTPYLDTARYNSTNEQIDQLALMLGNTSVGVTKQVLENAISEAAKGNAYRFDLIDASIQALKEQGLTENSVQSLVNASSGKLSAEFKSALTAAAEGNRTQLTALQTKFETELSQKTTALSQAIADVAAGNTSRFNAVDAAIKDLKASGLTEAQVQAVVDRSDANTSKTFQTALDSAVKGNTAQLTALQTAVQTQIGAVNTGLTEALASQSAITAQKLSTLDSKFTAAIAEAANGNTTALEALKTEFAASQSDIKSQLGTQNTALSAKVDALGTSLNDAITAAQAGNFDALNALKANFTDQVATTKTDLTTALQQQSTALNTRIDELVSQGQNYATATKQAIADLGLNVADLGTSFNTKLNTLGSTFTLQLGSVEKNILDRVAANEQAGMTRDQALQSAITTVAGDLGTTKADLLSKVGTTEAALNTRINTLADQLNTAQQSILDKVSQYEAAGLSRDAALKEAITDVAAQLGTTNTNLLSKLGTTESALNTRVNELSGQLNNVQKSLIEKINAYEQSGLARDTAINAAINDLSGNLGATRGELLAQIGTTESALTSKISALETAMAGRIDTVQKSILDRVAQYESAGMSRDQALNAAIAEVAGNLGTTKADLLSQLGATQEDLKSQMSAQSQATQTQITNLQKTILDQVEANEQAGMSRDQALQSAINTVATDLGTTRSAILSTIGATEANLTQRIGDLESTLKTSISNTERTLLDKIAANEAAGMTRDQALNAAVNDVASQLGTTRSDLLAQLGTTESALNTKVANLETKLQTQIQTTEKSILDRVAEYESAGMSRDQALNQAVNDVAADLGTTRSTLLNQIGTTEATLKSDIAATEARFTQQLSSVNTQLQAQIAANEAAGMSRDQAITAAVDKVASNLGTTRNELLSQIGATETTLTQRITDLQTQTQTQLTDLQKSIQNQMEAYEAAGMSRDQALDLAISGVAQDLGKSKSDLLAQMGTNQQQLQAQIEASSQAGQQYTQQQVQQATALLQAQITANQNAGMSAIAATNKAVQDVAAQLGTTTANLQNQIATSNSQLAQQIAAATQASQQYTQQQVQQSQQTIMDKMAAYEAAGMSRDQALNAAINDVSAQLGTTANNLLTQMGTNQQQLLAQIGQTQTQLQSDIAKAKQDIQAQMQAYEQAGVDRDTALSLAISGVSQQLGTTRSDLLSQLGTTETALRTEFTAQNQALSNQVQDVAALLGKPASQVTAADMQMVQNMVGGTAATNLSYDTNNDGKIDQTDVTNIQNQLTFQQNQNIKQQVDPNTGLTVYIDTTTGKEVSPPWTTPTGSQWASTGIYSVLDKQKAQQAATAKAQAATAKQAQQKSNFGSLMGLLFQDPGAAGQQVSVKTPDPAKINYIYDFSSIFANPSQASMMPSPYGPANTVAPKQPQQPQQAANQPLFQLASGFAGGGIVGSNDIQVGGNVDDLLEILKGNENGR